jgi:uncharacterized membrane protein YkvA (DUF1232 family)
MRIIDITRDWARRVKADALALWFARSHPATPWYAKALVLVVVAYALSPIDLIPDVIPILGYLDDVILLPVLIWLTVRLLPPIVRADSRRRAREWIAQRGAKPRSRIGGVMIVALWLAAAALLGAWWMRSSGP